MLPVDISWQFFSRQYSQRLIRIYLLNNEKTTNYITVEILPFKTKNKSIIFIHFFHFQIISKKHEINKRIVFIAFSKRFLFSRILSTQQSKTTKIIKVISSVTLRFFCYLVMFINQLVLFTTFGFSTKFGVDFVS